eukprot:Blabericola_migrator_1__1271@NODE_132_length_13257_cov_135_196133_g116_i0_p3_GENE_NODE_132_length_13257_cov_135_196133_g116_i0NODE_132_length_13257_cov_135_196133_g116_i0_p3_ORF_typecomplete_len590_score116_13TFIIS_M/PF07500_14/2_2e13ZirS_C/PF16583_5/0_42_NODE_132_length_13257_cov_135_196133_g116_i031944963
MAEQWTTDETNASPSLLPSSGTPGDWGEVYVSQDASAQFSVSDYRLLLQDNATADPADAHTDAATAASYITRPTTSFVDHLHPTSKGGGFELFTDSTSTSAESPARGETGEGTADPSSYCHLSRSVGPTEFSFITQSSTDTATYPGGSAQYVQQPGVSPSLEAATYRYIQRPMATPPAAQDAASQAKMWAKIEKLRDVFFKGLEEYRNCSEPIDALIPGLNDSTSADGALKLSALVIQAMDQYCYQSGMDPRLERQKFHELYQNLKRDNNKELRFKIFKGEIPIEQLVAMDAKDLAPEALKRKRETESEKYFQQQVILKEDTTSAVIRKTHKGLETVGDDEGLSINKQDLSKSNGTSSSAGGEQSDANASAGPASGNPNEGDQAPHFLATGPVPWQDEMANLLETQTQSAAPSPVKSNAEVDDSVEPPGKRARLGPELYVNAPETDKASPGIYPDKSPSTCSPAAFTQLVFRPWESLAWNHKELFQKLRLTEAPCDPADGSLRQEVTRLEERLKWLKMQSEKRFEKYLKDKDLSGVKGKDVNKALRQIRHLTESLSSHSQKVSESMSIPLTVPELVLPAGVMMPPPMHI